MVSKETAQRYVTNEKSEKIDLFLDLVEVFLSEAKKLLLLCIEQLKGILKTYLKIVLRNSNSLYVSFRSEE